MTLNENKIGTNESRKYFGYTCKWHEKAPLITKNQVKVIKNVYIIGKFFDIRSLIFTLLKILTAKITIKNNCK